MTKDWQNSLLEDFPNLYKKPIYFEMPEAWEPIVRKLSERLEELIIAENMTDEDDRIYAAQVKEKFGGLRFYMSYSTAEIDCAIREAEEEIYALEVHTIKQQLK